MKKHSMAVLIGRWQIFHRGHETLLHAALQSAGQVIVAIGSAFRSRDARNPFTWQERQAMIEASLSQEQRKRVHYLPLRDYYDDVRWNSALQQGVEKISKGSSDIALVGFKKDHTSYYLDHFPQWAFVAIERELDIDATALRNFYFSKMAVAEKQAQLQRYLSPAVLQYLMQWASSEFFESRVEEHLAVVDYKKRWTAQAYLTADAVVQANQHVLLIQRGGVIGHGQWALPGGFVDKNERFFHAAVRELAEETQLHLSRNQQHTCLKASHVFDHPLRSPRGHIITQAFHFDLGVAAQLPAIRAADDAKDAQWVKLADLPDLEDQLFEDHAAILDHFFGIYQGKEPIAGIFIE